MRETYLIIHLDDIGLCHAANEAAKELFLAGTATSASVMMPCSWAKESWIGYTKLDRKDKVLQK